MLMPLNRWEEVREWFSEDERLDLNLAIVGESVCPKGAILDETKLSPALREKVAFHFQRTERRRQDEIDQMLLRHEKMMGGGA
jgi:hypothetical protein